MAAIRCYVNRCAPIPRRLRWRSNSLGMTAGGNVYKPRHRVHLDDLVVRLRRALGDLNLTAVADVVRDAIGEKPFLTPSGSSRLLHTEPGLTVLHTSVKPGFVSPPHDHRTWAVIGIYDGQEDNTFYRLMDNSELEQCGSRSLRRGDVLILGTDAIHQIANPLSRKLIALHVYGENILKIERSAWDPATGNRRPFKPVLQ